MAKASNNQFPSVLFGEGSTPTSPGAGTQRIFIDSADHKLKRVNSSGSVTTIEGAGGGGSGAVACARFTGPNSGTDITTTSTTFVDLTGYTVSIAAAAGDILEITLSGTYFGSTSSDRGEFQLAYNGTLAGPIYRMAIPAVAAQIVTFTFQHVVVSGDISAGNVPVKVQWRRNSSGGAGPVNWLDSGGIYGQLSVKNLLH